MIRQLLSEHLIGAVGRRPGGPPTARSGAAKTYSKAGKVFSTASVKARK
ncbi:hypothetical protein [Streptomyces sp. NPDC006739]